MKSFLKNYKSTIILLLSCVIGIIVGLIFGEKAKVLSPFGDLFINLLLTIIVPLIFLTITTSIGKMKQPKRLGKILISVIVVFIITSLISVLIGTLSTGINLVNAEDAGAIKEVFDTSIEENTESLNILERTIKAISTDDFVKIISKDNIIPLIIFSILIGLSINLAKDKGNYALKVLESFNEVLQKFFKIIMYYAPIGLGCYLAAFIGTFGKTIVIGYLKTFVIYVIACLVVYFIVYYYYF